MPTTFANTIDGNDIYAKRAECDAAGNTLSTTYATKAELPTIVGLTAGSNITITEGQDSITISATDTTYSAGTGLSLSGTTFSNSDPLPAHTSTESGKVLGVDSNGDLGWVNQSGGGGGGSYSAGTGIDITNDVISVDTTTVAMKTDIPSVPVTDVTVDGVSVVSNGTAVVTMPSVDQTYDGTSTNAQSGVAVAGAISGKQDTLTAGTNITISSNTISATDTTYSAGTGIDITNDVISVEAPVDIVGGPGIVIDNPDGNTLRVSTDENYETVLWDKGSGTALGNGTNTATLSEAMSNFEFVRFEAEWQVYASDSDRTYNFVCKVFRPNPVRFAIDSMCGYGSTTNTMYSAVSRFNINASMTEVSFLSKVCWLATNVSTGISLGPTITKIVGIRRIAGGN